jgi:hypothetical protein
LTVPPNRTVVRWTRARRPPNGSNTRVRNHDRIDDAASLPPVFSWYTCPVTDGDAPRRSVGALGVRDVDGRRPSGR